MNTILSVAEALENFLGSVGQPDDDKLNEVARSAFLAGAAIGATLSGFGNTNVVEEAKLLLKQRHEQLKQRIAELKGELP